MAIRNRHRLGTHLVVDEESGFIHYSDNVVRRWDGVIVAKTSHESRHPQEFIRIPKESKIVSPIVPEPLVAFTTVEQQPFIGNTSVFTPLGPASHLFGYSGPSSIQQGIGFSIIESPSDALVFEVQ